MSTPACGVSRQALVHQIASMNRALTYPGDVWWQTFKEVEHFQWALCDDSFCPLMLLTQSQMPSKQSAPNVLTSCLLAPLPVTGHVPVVYVCDRGKLFSSRSHLGMRAGRSDHRRRRTTSKWLDLITVCRRCCNRVGSYGHAKVF